MKKISVVAIMVVHGVAAIQIFAATPTPTPTPAILITPESSLPVRWSAIVKPANCNGVGCLTTRYEFAEKIGMNYRTMAFTPATITTYNVPHIGKLPRTFAVRAWNTGGPGVWYEFVFPGAVKGAWLIVPLNTP